MRQQGGKEPGVTDTGTIHGLISALLGELKQLKSVFLGRPDLRLWNPDETCEPFYLETQQNPTAGVAYLTFTVPQGRRGVIAHFITSNNITVAGVNKSTNRIMIRRTGQGAPGVAADLSCIPLNGSVVGTLESDAAQNVAGFCFGNGTLVRPVRIPLEQGTYEVYSVNGGSTLVVAVSGWTYPERRP